MSNKIRIFIILFVFTVGTLGFYIIEGTWTILEAFYMTIITITTVGYGEVKPLSPHGQIFTIFFIILGLSTAAILASELAKQFVERNFKAIYGAGKMRKKITKLQNHYIVCGFGDIGSSMSASLKEASIPFVIIENSVETAEFATMQNYLVVNGKATYDDTLIEAGIKEARGIVICLGDDSLNMYVSLAARELNPDLLILVRGYKTEGEKRMIRAGANSVIYPLKLGGQQMAQLVISEYSKENKSNHLELTTSGIMGYSLKMYKHFKEEETTIENILNSTNASQALKIQRIGGVEINRPGIETVVKKGESILLLDHDEFEEDLSEDIDLKENKPPGEEQSSSQGYKLYAWDDSYSLGIPILDDEHKKLLRLLNNFLSSIHTKDEKSIIKTTFDSLLEYTQEHFANEEAFMSKHKYPDLKKHKKEHIRLTKEAVQLNENKDYIFSDNIADFLISWLTNHIMGTDKKYAEFILARDPGAGSIENSKVS
ncbi:MAG: bacteriohemerythrin [Spirochaetota bacterium]|nr:bacteriohemerythrin [Spirochaetota bacterium]